MLEFNLNELNSALYLLTGQVLDDANGIMVVVSLPGSDKPIILDIKDIKRTDNLTATMSLTNKNENL